MDEISDFEDLDSDTILDVLIDRAFHSLVPASAVSTPSILKRGKEARKHHFAQIGQGRVRKHRRQQQSRKSHPKKQHIDFIDEDEEDPPDPYLFPPDDDVEPEMYQLSHFLKIHSREPSRSESRHAYTEQISFELTNFDDARRIDLLLIEIFEHLIKLVIAEAGQRGPPKKIGIQIYKDTFRSPFYVPLRPIEQNTAAAIAAEFEKLSQSEELQLFEGILQCKIYGVWSLPVDRGQGGCNNWQESTTVRQCRSLVPIRNTDRHCLARAAAIGFAQKSQNFKLLCTDEQLQGRIASALMRQSGLPLNLESYGVAEAKKIQGFLNREWPGQYRITIFAVDKFMKIIYKGTDHPVPNEISLVLQNRHYSYIGSPRELFKSRGYCLECERIAHVRTYHYRGCKYACRLCLRFGMNYPCKRLADEPRIQCPNCHFIFENRDCFDFHLRTEQSAEAQVEDRRARRTFPSICETRRQCQLCWRIVFKRDGPHDCVAGAQALQMSCFNCRTTHGENEPYCYIQPLAEEKIDRRVRYVFYDIETTQNRQMCLGAGEMVGKHEPILLVAEVLCVVCMDEQITGAAPPTGCCCGVFGSRFRHRHRMLEQGNRRLLGFHSLYNPGVKPVTEFLDWLQNSGPRNITTIVIAHNGGKFDHHFLLEDLYSRGEKPKLVTTGLKIYSMQIDGPSKRKLIFKDSINFFSTSLAALWHTFELGAQGIANKPYFPYLYIRRENMEIVRPCLPEPNDYGREYMKPGDQEKFDAWYASNQATPFSLRDQILEYCRNDVEILRGACVKFRSEMRHITSKLDPFMSASTIARLAMNVFRAEFLPPKTLVNLPERGINCRGRQSIAALKFFKLLEKLFNWEIRTAEWGIGEAKNDDTGHRIDGLVQKPSSLSNLALEFNGCYFHGCRECFPARDARLAGGRTAEELYERTVQRAHILEQRGKRVISIWQCKFEEAVKKNAPLRAMYQKIFIAEPLNPRRDALRGGRTEPFRLFVEAKEDEEIEMTDIVSLYPSVMKNGIFPIGMPQLVTPEGIRQMAPPTPWTTPKQNPFLGIIKCRVLPPVRMLVEGRPVADLPPLLPYKDPGKQIVFPLCAMCADKQNDRVCRHSELQRSWIAGFTHLELNLAMTFGYRVLEVFEVEHYPDGQWASRERGNGLFDKQINAFLKIKVEASGWPAGVQTPEQRRAFIDEYRAEEGIELEESRIHLNGGLRACAKSLLVALWGKYCQRANSTSVRLTSTPAEFHKLLDDCSLEIIDAAHVNESLDRVVCRAKEPLQKTPKTNNVTIAVFVTSQARIHLFTYIQQAVMNGAKLIYCDTDSLFLLRKQNAHGITTGNRLGEMMRELADRRIMVVICPGPKNYSLRHDSRTAPGTDLQEITKIRGFHLNCKAKKKLGFDTMRRLLFKKFAPLEHDDVADVDDESPTIHFPEIRRDKFGNVYTRTASKRYTVAFKKGIVAEEFIVRPFGFFHA